MKTTRLASSILIMVLAQVLLSCLREVDPGPLQLEERDYTVLDFDRIDAGDAFIIEIQQGPVYKVYVKGDRRNLNDLEVVKLGTTLSIDYARSGEHSHETFVKITMPSFSGGNFSGASNFTIVGFKGSDNKVLELSGASIGQMNGEAKFISISLSGASRLTISGSAEEMTAWASGASQLEAFGFSALDVNAEAWGASRMNLFASRTLKAAASGASVIYYRGNPGVTAVVSGASSIEED